MPKFMNNEQEDKLKMKGRLLENLYASYQVLRDAISPQPDSVAVSVLMEVQEDSMPFYSEISQILTYKPLPRKAREFW